VDKKGSDHGYGSLAFEVASSISFPRLTGGSGERVARERVRAALAAAGLEVSEEWFYCSDFAIRVAARWAMAPTGVLLLASALALGADWAGSALVLALVSFLPVAYMASRVSAGFHSETRRARFRCANVIGRASGEAGAPVVVLMAHYDSKSQAFPIWLRISLFVVAALGSFALIALVAACAAIDMLGESCVFEPAVLPAAVALLIIDLSFIFNSVGDLSDGALDNATPDRGGHGRRGDRALRGQRLHRRAP